MKMMLSDEFFEVLAVYQKQRAGLVCNLVRPILPPSMDVVLLMVMIGRRCRERGR